MRDPSCRPTRFASLLRPLLLGAALLAGALLTVGEAQVTTAIIPDGTLGTTVTQTGRDVAIQGGTQSGGNLFHSFDRLSVGTGDTATFKGPHGVTNIVGRVTGGLRSEIDGMLGSEIPGANPFLLNPSGVLFGPNARLDVQGSFHVSTADYLRLADGGQFFARLGPESVLTVAPPTAFGFLGPQPGQVRLQPGSALEVPPGQALSVVGGDITLEGSTLRAPSGRLQLASVASPGEVRFSPLELAPDLQTDGVPRLGRLELSQGALLEASGEGGGTVLIRGGVVHILDRSQILATTRGSRDGHALGVDLHGAEETVIRGGALLQTGTQGAGRAGAIRLTGGRLQIRDATVSSASGNAGRAGDVTITVPTVIMEPGSTLTSGTAAGSHGDAGDLTLQVGRLTLTGGVVISSGSEGTGRGGSLTISATEEISITGRAPMEYNQRLNLLRSGSDTTGSRASEDPQRGPAGPIVITAPSVQLRNNATLRANTRGNKDSGAIRLQVGRLTIADGAAISASSFGAGRGGEVVIEATVEVSLTGPSAAVFTDANASGAAGRIFIRAPRLRLEWDGQGGSPQSLPARLQARTGAGTSGDAGDIVLEVGRLTLTGRAQIETSTAGSGRGGTIQISAREIQLHNGAVITARSTGMGAAGRIRIEATETFRSRGGRVTTESSRAGGGQIELRAGALVLLLDQSALTTTVQGGGGDAGNLTIDAPFVVAEASQITANAFGGQGGNVRIGGEVVFVDPASQVSASSTLGVQGTIDIQAPVTNLSSVVTPLPERMVSEAGLLRDRCAARLWEGRVSSLVERGRTGVPANPDGVLPSRLAPGSAGVVSSAHEAVVAPQGEVRPDGKGHRKGRRARESDCVAQ
jgi:filamentous hemagglutinin family protein